MYVDVEAAGHKTKERKKEIDGKKKRRGVGWQRWGRQLGWGVLTKRSNTQTQWTNHEIITHNRKHVSQDRREKTKRERKTRVNRKWQRSEKEEEKKKKQRRKNMIYTRRELWTLSIQLLRTKSILIYQPAICVYRRTILPEWLSKRGILFLMPQRGQSRGESGGQADHIVN